MRRKVFDDTGYDVELTDAVDLQALVAIEKLITDMVLDEREPGTFDPVAHMRASLLDEIRKAKLQQERAGASFRPYPPSSGSLGKRPGKDVVGHMLRARIKAIATAISETEAKIDATERACDMLDGYLYVMDTPMLEEEEPASDIEWDEASGGPLRRSVIPAGQMPPQTLELSTGNRVFPPCYCRNPVAPHD